VIFKHHSALTFSDFFFLFVCLPTELSFVHRPRPQLEGPLLLEAFSAPVGTLPALGLFLWSHETGNIYVWLCLSQTRGSRGTRALSTGRHRPTGSDNGHLMPYGDLSRYIRFQTGSSSVLCDVRKLCPVLRLGVPNFNAVRSVGC